MKYLVTINIPFAYGDGGIPHTDPLWAKDIEHHARCVSELQIAAPLETGPPRPEWVPVHRVDGVRMVDFVPVPAHDSLLSAWLDRGRIAAALAPAIAAADVVQTNVAGWPLPLGWVAGPRARALGKPTVVVVESAPWRGAKGIRKAKSLIFEHMARREVRAAQIAFFTHASYRDELIDRARGRPRSRSSR